MIGGDWEVERQTPDSSIIEVKNGMGKTYQCEDIGKLGNNLTNIRLDEDVFKTS